MPDSEPQLTSAKGPILIVESDAAVRSMLERVLVAEGYSVWSSPDCRDALKIACEHRFQAVLLQRDENLLKLRDPLEEFRARHPEIAAIVVTADPHQANAALARGAAACFEKPLDFPALLNTIGHLPSNPSGSTGG